MLVMLVMLAGSSALRHDFGFLEITLKQHHVPACECVHVLAWVAGGVTLVVVQWQRSFEAG